MLARLKTLTQAVRRSLAHALHRKNPDTAAAQGSSGPALRWPRIDLSVPPRLLRRILLVSGALALVGGIGYALVRFPPLRPLPQGHLALRSNLLTGHTDVWRQGPVWILPGLHELRMLSLEDQTWAAMGMVDASASGAPQTIEGLSLGLDLRVRYAIDPRRLSGADAQPLSTDLVSQVVEPAVQATVYKIVARHTVREIFSSQRAEIEQAIEAGIGERLKAQGLVLRSVQIGRIDLPTDYRRGMEALLSEDLSTQKMRYTLELREQQVKESELSAAAEKARREVNAEAAAREQVIAAKAQEEAMKHVLPFKERQIEQRKLEAEANRVSRVQQAEGEAQARRIEAQGEADARQKLADAEAYRLTRVGKANAEQMAAEGALITKHPLLIQKTMADRLSDKVQVIIASPHTGGFIGNNLLGVAAPSASSQDHASADTASDTESGVQ